MQRPEEPIQKGGNKAIALLYPVGIVFHIPNQRFGKFLRMILHGLGVLPGIPDVGVIRPYSQIGWIEYKAPGGKLNDSQKELHPRMLFLGHVVHVVDDISQIQPITQAWRAEDAAIAAALAAQ